MDNNKPFDLMCMDETENLRQGVMSVINNSQLPISIRKMVFTSVANEIVAQMDKFLEDVTNKYYQSLNETPEEG